jgi:L-lactate dehydrogenase complex protein LldG
LGEAPQGAITVSRADIFARVRSALDGSSSVQARRNASEQRLTGGIRHPRPQIAALEGGERLARFKDCLLALCVAVIEVATRDEIPAAIAAYLGALGLPQRLRRGSDPQLTALQWSSAPCLAIDVGPAQGDDAVGLSRAVAGVAETGTLALASGIDNPVTLGFLPDTHIVVLDASAVVAGYEDACALVMARGGGTLPRTLNFITGASRTGDIGGKIVMGAHGPRRLAVVLVQDVEATS